VVVEGSEAADPSVETFAVDVEQEQIVLYM
jgi:hypothetical protein